MPSLLRTSLVCTVLLVAACDSSSSGGGGIDAGSSSGFTPPPPVNPPTPDGGTPATAEVTADDLAKRGNCPTPTGTGTTHSAPITADETWTAAGSPHIVPQSASLRIKATVTIEPCAVVLLDKSADIQIGSTTEAGKIVAHGTATVVDGGLDVRPVTFDAVNPANPWTQIAVETMGSLDLAVASVQNGGNVIASEPGAILVRGVAGGTNTGPITQSLKVDRVLVEKSATYGIDLDGWGAFADGSQKLWIRNSGSAATPYPIRLEPGVAKTLPTDLVATGNVKDEILVSTVKTFMVDDTYVARGLPYHQKGALYVSGSTDNTTVTLKIEPGVTVAFEDNAGTGMYIGSSAVRLGNLVAVGTAASPITFTSAKATKAPGDWMSLDFRQSTGSHVSYARIEYAGAFSGANGFGCGPSTNDAAIFVGGIGGNETAPASAFVDNTTFDHIGGTTVIVSGWVDDTGPNFAPTNTFGADTPGCKVSKPRPTNNVCDAGRMVCWP